MAFHTKDINAAYNIELCGTDLLKSLKNDKNTDYCAVDLVSKVHCTRSSQLYILCTGFFKFSCPVIYCRNNLIWNPCSSIVSPELFQKWGVILFISDLMRRWEYWCHIKQPLGNLWLWQSLPALCDVIGYKFHHDCMHCHASLTSIMPGCSGCRQKGWVWQHWYGSGLYSGYAFLNSHSMVIVTICL